LHASKNTGLEILNVNLDEVQFHRMGQFEVIESRGSDFEGGRMFAVLPAFAN